MRVTPIVLVPGYLGTRLRHRGNGRLVWGTFRALYRTTPDELAGDCEPAGPVEAITVIPRVWKYDIYGRIKRALGPRLHVFEYDWRRSHADTARELVRWLDRFNRPVHAIAHSTGGYLLDWALRYGEAPIEKAHDVAFAAAKRFASLLWVGVPWEGTVAAVRDMTIGWKAAPFGRRFPPEMVRKFPSVYEAVPTWRGAWRGHDGRAIERDPFEGAPRARLFRGLLERGPRWAPVRSHVIVSDRIRTRAAVCVTERGLSFDRYWGPGDGTVTIGSSLRGGHTLPPSVTVHRVRGRHRYLLSRPAVVKLIRSLTS